MEGTLDGTGLDINPSFAASSFSLQQALECNFPSEGFVFRGGRHEVTAFCRIMALRRLPSQNVKLFVTDGKPNSKYRCEGCGNGIMTIRFGPNIVRNSSPCTCSVRQHVRTRLELLTTEFSNNWDLQAQAVGFFFDVLKIPLICIASKGPFPLTASGKGFWLKHFDGRWIHIPIRVVRKNKVSFYHVKSFPDENEINSAFQGQQTVTSTPVASLPPPSLAPEQKDPSPEHTYRDCVCCQDKHGIYRFVCRCTEDVDCQYCKECLADVISTRKTQMDRMEREPIFLNFSESKKSSALTCSICREKVTEFYRCFTDPKEATRCAFPIGWLHERPFYNQDEIDVYHPVFLEKVEPIRVARSKILLEISRLTAEKDNYREEMANLDRNWSYDDNVARWDRSIRMQEDELKKHVFPKWSLHPSSYSENDEDCEKEPPTKIRKYAEVFHVGAQEERYNAGLARARFEEEGRHEDREVVEVIDLSEDGPARPPR
jgi:hypothetical protein